MDTHLKYILNPAYFLKNDIRRAVIGDNDGIRESNDIYSDNITSPIHPKIAQMLSFFNGERTLQESIEAIGYYFNITSADVAPIVEKYIENQPFKILHQNNYSRLPTNVLVKKKNHKRYNRYSPEQFEVTQELDLSPSRYYKPIQCTLELLFKCYTDCIYCYADRSKHNSSDIMTLEQIIKIIRDAKSIGMVNIDINGGEVLMHKNYKEILSELASNNYFPLISTKIPIKEDVLKFLKDIGMLKLQISIDSVNQQILADTLKIGESYLEQLLDTMSLIDEMGFPWQTNSIITKYNSSLDDIKSLLNKLLSYRNNTEIRINPAGYSLYKSVHNYSNLKPSAESMDLIESYVNTLPEIQRNKIIVGGGNYVNNMTLEARTESFPKRSICSGNHSSFFVLPDGKVTICEELYWHPHFIIGDLTKQSIMEMWQSPKARNLYYISQNEIRPESKCKTCVEFSDCRRPVGICWKEVVMAYGNENWDYPTPGCPLAPIPINDICIR